MTNPQGAGRDPRNGIKPNSALEVPEPVPVNDWEELVVLEVVEVVFPVALEVDVVVVLVIEELVFPELV
jgi:hypothetical protein